MTETPEVEIFTGVQGDAYARWLNTHPLRAVLNVKNPSYGTIHDADCFTIGPYSDPTNLSVGHKKVCGKLKHVRAWAEAEGVQTDWCENCRG